MKRPVRALIDGTAIALAVILLVIIVVFLSHCGSEKSSGDTAYPVEILSGHNDK